MRIRTVALALVLSVSSATMAIADDTPVAVSTASVPSITRFAQVADRLFRGGQPERSDFSTLRDLGIDTVISFREGDDERATVEALGMKFVHLPVTMVPFGLNGPVSKATIDAFFKVVDDPASGKVFVHCLHGKDRTGLFVSLYRIGRQGWDVDAAYREARGIGMSWWHFPAKNTMERFAAANDHD